ncbi:MAG: NAD(+)/NADH kinase, partial [Balneolaceae bacterium]
MKLCVIANPKKYSIREPLESIIAWCKTSGSSLYVARELSSHFTGVFHDKNITFVSESESEAIKEAEVVVAVGGDGTMLHTAHLLRNQSLPVLGINTGKLGFMANIQPSQIDDALNSVLNRDYKIDKRLMLQASSFDGSRYVALNEFLFSKKDASSLITLDVEYDGNLINSYWADGLIISSPTGSTAYNLSAGGPIIMPGTPVMTVTPINPHTLTTRPLVLPSNLKLRIKSANPYEQILFSYDGIMLPYSNKLDVEIMQSEYSVSLIQLPG